MEGIYNNINEKINFWHSREENPGQAEFHLHERFEIYFFMSGNVNYFIDKKVYTLHYGDLILMNSHEIHKPSISPGEPYERIGVHFDPSLAKALSSPSFNLLNCFTNRPVGEENLVSLNKKQCEEIIRLFGRLETLKDETSNGCDVLKLSCFLELLVFVNRVFSSSLRQEETLTVPEKLAPVLDYIDSNLENDLSLEFLEQHFYINRFYLSRLFKKVTGSSLHEYIQYKRISKAKRLLSDGLNVTEACTESGFNDYSNFLRIFRKTVGMSPGRYRKVK